MFDHVTIRVADRVASERFYETVLAALDLRPEAAGAHATRWGEFAVAPGRVVDHLWIRVADVAAATGFYEAIAPYAALDPHVNDADHTWVKGRRGSFSLVSGEPTQHLHMALATNDDTAVDAFHRAALESGYRDGRPPGTRRVHGRDGYAASVLDPAANTIELVSRSANCAR